jgi:hypothetical protein
MTTGGGRLRKRLGPDEWLFLGITVVLVGCVVTVFVVALSWT